MNGYTSTKTAADPETEPTVAFFIVDPTER